MFYKYFNNTILRALASIASIVSVVFLAVLVSAAPAFAETQFSQTLPWWSKSAPKILKNLDFSKVTGDSETYEIGEKHRLKLLAEQGNWGKVYALELWDKKDKPKNIAAVKVLLTRQDRKMSRAEFHTRHREEIEKNIRISAVNLDNVIKPYGVQKLDEDHYLLFLEYGENGYNFFKQLSAEESTRAKLIDQIFTVMSNIHELHLAGFAHGDLQVDNILFVKGKVKLCDWFSLTDIKNTQIEKYRYIGWNLPPEAIRAHYFGTTSGLQYANVVDQGQQKQYMLNPITADWFCLAISFLEFLAPELHEEYTSILYNKNFNPYKPKSLDFWQQHADFIRKAQKELLARSEKSTTKKERLLFLQLSKFIDLNPMKRVYVVRAE